MDLKTGTFRQEIEAAMKSYDRHIVCLFKTPDECLDAIERLLLKAIKAYENRAEGAMALHWTKRSPSCLANQMKKDHFALSILTYTARITAKTEDVI